jgi:putative transposase
MPQSLARIHLHLVFSTKNREPWLRDSLRDDLHAYVAAILRNAGCPVTAMNSVEDHIHILFELSRTKAMCWVAEEVKTTSSKWMKTRGDALAGFAWQTGYGVFAVSASSLPNVCRYIAAQREHHARRSFQDEYREMLERNRLTYNERHVWT